MCAGGVGGGRWFGGGFDVVVVVVVVVFGSGEVCDRVGVVRIRLNRIGIEIGIEKMTDSLCVSLTRLRAYW